MKTLLRMALPTGIVREIDFSEMNIDFTTDGSDDMKDHYSDIVVKTRRNSSEGESMPLDISILVEHKTEAKKKSLVQIRKYLYLEWKNVKLMAVI